MSKPVSLAERELILRLVRTMQRADPVWCEMHGLVPVTDEEWDEVLGEAEDYVEGFAATAAASDKGRHEASRCSAAARCQLPPPVYFKS